MVIEESIGQYEYIEQSGYNDVYGFSDENFESNKYYNNENLKIILSYKINKRKKNKSQKLHF